MFLWIFIFFNIFYIISIARDDLGTIDTAWGLSFFVILCSGIQDFSSLNWRQLTLLVIVGLWATRLSGYIFYRNLKIGKEDYRYEEMRNSWGESYKITAYFKVFMLQGVLAIIIGYPLFLVSQSDPGAFTILDGIGLSIWLYGFLVESIADYQKDRFKSNPENKGKIIMSGLWKYSRHPNYYGEAVLWWGIFLFLCSSLNFYIIIISPIVLTFLLLKVSGVALLEQKYKDHPDFEKYKNSTNAFILWFNKESNS
jgi:steroid 5-alpha reductase family enzyme